MVCCAMSVATTQAIRSGGCRRSSNWHSCTLSTANHSGPSWTASSPPDRSLDSAEHRGVVANQTVGIHLELLDESMQQTFEAPTVRFEARVSLPVGLDVEGLHIDGGNGDVRRVTDP